LNLCCRHPPPGGLSCRFRPRTFQALRTIGAWSNIELSQSSIQLAVAALVTAIPGISLFHFAIATQTLNAMILPLVFYYLIRLTSDQNLMGKHVNSSFERTFTSWASVLIVIASAVTIAALVFRP
jgi:Mn2+/Fe2+ NRAMP family transporter